MKSRDQRRVLVLDADQASALAIVRSLGRRGMTIDAAERRPKFLSSHSRFVHEAFTYPDPLTDAEAFVDAIEDRVRSTRYDVVIPVAEDTVHPLALRRARIERHTKLAVAPTEALETMLDKAKTFALARSLGVPVPESTTFTDEGALERAAAGYRYPVVLKPSRSIGFRPGAAGANDGAASRTKLSVTYAHDADELVRLGKSALRHGDLIVQEYFRGAGVGIELLADHGEIVYAFQHKRLHELPLTGGGSCLRECVPVNPVLLEHAKKLVAATKWHGVAMVEFKLDEATNECRLMEVNGRFWGSLPLAVAAGADFPYLLVDLLTTGKRPDPSMPPARVGTVCRKLSSDVYWYAQVLRRDQDEPLITWPTKQDALKDLLLGLSPRHSFDVQSLSDVVPGVVDALQTGEWLVDRVRSVLDEKRLLRAAESERRRGVILRDFARAKEVLFVCYGNINRSALAERHLRSLLGHGASPRLTSAGFHPEPGRPVDPSMVAVAARHGFALDGTSRVLDAATIERADLVLAMERKHLLRLAAEYPSARAKCHLLGAAAPESLGAPLEIADPWGGDDAAFERCFADVTACTRELARALDQRPRAG